MIDAMTGDGRVRIDKWLWAARFFKTRTLAAEAIELGRVRVNGERVKPAREARVGELVELTAAESRREVVVVALSAQRGAAAVAQRLYAETEDSRARNEQRRELRRYASEPARSIKGRPTKREGRALRSLRTPGEQD
jgi:ribosome-associated heat shock protein Hsp15